MLKKTLVIGIIAFLLIFLLPFLFHFLTDFWWFQNLGYENILLISLKAKIFLGLIVGLISFFVLYLNSAFVKKILKSNLEEITVKPGKKINFNFSLVYSLVIGLFIGIGSASQWEVVLKYFNSSFFNVTDPIFSKDLSFYFFSLPFVKFLISLGFVLVIFSFIFFLLRFIILKGKSFFLLNQGRFLFNFKKKVTKEKSNRQYIYFMASLVFILVAINLALVKIPSIVYQPNNSFNGAGYSALHVTLPFLKVLFVVSLLVAVSFLINIFKKRLRLIYFTVGGYLVIAILGTWLAPALLQRLVVLPNELVKEKPYIEYGISATRKAFNLDQVVSRELEEETKLTMEDINNNSSTIKNIRLWDRDPLLDTFSQIQEIRTYYDFVSIDNDRYYIDGDYRQVLLSPRELNSANLPQRNFINEHLTFTHGYGLTLGPVNEVTPEGLPLLFLKDLPPVSSKDSLRVNQPEIYYGELSNNYVVVNNKSQEFDYPAGNENVFVNYQGEGGVKLDSFLKKIFFAIKFNSLKIILSNDIIPESRIMYYRDIESRITKLLPFLEFDQDPYMVITDEGKLKWIADAYTTSDKYPYAQTINKIGQITSANSAVIPEKINYIRNSAKVVVDAYDGGIKIYLTYSEDPIIKTYSKIFKDTFLPLSEMSEDLRKHVRYPEGLFNYQTKIYSIYHMNESQIFYNKEDQWEIPWLSSSNVSDPIMRRMVMKLPGEEKEEYIIMLPFTPKGKNNLTAWMVARSDGKNYGEIVVYKFPKQKLVFGPQQIINRINQDTDISQQLTLWDQRGSHVAKGNLLVIPIEKSLLYVQPIYLESEGGQIPELKRIIIAYQNEIVMEKTLNAALERLFLGEVKDETQKDTSLEESTRIDRDLIKEAQEYYNNALEAQKEGDWSKYGEEMEELGKIINLLK